MHVDVEHHSTKEECARSSKLNIKLEIINWTLLSLAFVRIFTSSFESSNTECSSPVFCYRYVLTKSAMAKKCLHRQTCFTVIVLQPAKSAETTKNVMNRNERCSSVTLRENPNVSLNSVWMCSVISHCQLTGCFAR